MPPPVILLHSDEVAFGTALIQSAIRAVCRDGGGLVAAWDLTHTMPPQISAEAAVARMLAGVDGAGRSSTCFCFRSTPGVRRPGLVPPHSSEMEQDSWRRFEPSLAVLAAEVAAGGLGLLVSIGPPPHADTDAKMPFRPGILRFYPSTSTWDSTDSPVFGEAGFPTLIVSPQVEKVGRSAHERLELCTRLATYMAEDLRRFRPPPVA